MSVSSKSLVVSLEVNTNDNDVWAELLPDKTSVEVIVIIGLDPSYVHVNGVVTRLVFPAESTYVPAGTSIVHNPSSIGVNVPLY